MNETLRELMAILAVDNELLSRIDNHLADYIGEVFGEKKEDRDAEQVARSVEVATMSRLAIKVVRAEHESLSEVSQ